MPYYVFERCPEEKVNEIGELCELEGLTSSNIHEDYGDPEKDRQWQNREKGIVVQYVPSFEKEQLTVQTHGNIGWRNPEILSFVRKLMHITGTYQIGNNRIRNFREPYDTRLFFPDTGNCRP